MKAKLLVCLLLAGASMFAAPRVVVGVGFGGGVYAPAPPPVVASAYIPPAPGVGYSWVGGYWYPYGARYRWHAGYWSRPPYAGARWIAPRYHSHYYYRGYWRR